MLVTSACVSADPSAPRKCATGVPIRIVYADYGRSNQESGQVMGLDRDGEPTRLVKGDDYAFRPQFSPDGSQVVFVSARKGDPETGSNFDLYVINSDGTEERLVEKTLSAGDPSWSPDGKWILFIGNYAEASGGIYRVRPDGSDLKKMIEIPEPRRPHSPVWSPDGDSIAWVEWDISNESAPNVITLASAEGTEPRALAEVDGAKTLDWSPDGRLLSATSGGGTEGVFLVDVESGDVETVREGAVGGRWTADGSGLLYAIDPQSPESRYVQRDMASGEESELSLDADVGYGFQFDVDPLPCELD